MALLPVVTYNDPILRIKTKPVESSDDSLQKLIDDMFDTMHNAHGVGLAAPQIGKDIQLFIVDADVMMEHDEALSEFMIGSQVFINPVITEKSDEKIHLEEGCLSLPEIRDKVFRPRKITVNYLDRNLNKQQLIADDWLSRVIQHEFDHLQGILFIDYIGSFRKRLIQTKLSDIDSGSIDVGYPVKPKS